ncbi:MAG: DUF962 domain-containing protein [Acidobacteriota bacterium]|nr:DUF962 domain-containing protein [Acidobacteriota bacterium]
MQMNTDNFQGSTGGSPIATYAEFWDFYVAEHSEPLTRLLHFVGTSLGIVLLVWIIRSGNYIYLPLCLIVGYAFAWFSHFFVEHNKPASFKYPLWSFASDYKMMWFMLTGRMDAEVGRVTAKN